MDLEDLHKIHHSFAKHPWLTVLGIIIILGIVFLGKYFSGYMGEKGRQHASNTDTAKKGIIPKDYGVSQDLVNDLQNKLNLKDREIERFLIILDEKGIAIKDRDTKLWEMAANYKELEKRLSESQIDTVLVQARRMLSEGDFENTEKLLSQLYETKLHASAENKKDAALAAFELGSVREVQLDYQGAKKAFEQGLQLEPDNTEYLNRAGNVFRSLGKYQKAMNIYEKALIIDLKTYGKQSVEVARDYNNIGLALNSLEKFSKSTEYIQMALDIYLKANGEHGSEVGTVYNNLGLAWNSRGKYKKAIGFIEKALAINTEVYGEKHINVAIDYANLGASWLDLKEYKITIDYLQKALDIYFRNYGEQYPDIAIIYNNLAGALGPMGECKKAIEYLEKAISISLKFYGEQHANSAMIYTSIGSNWDCLKKYDKAIEYYKRALAIAINIHGEQSFKVGTIYNNIGHDWIKLSEYNKGIEYIEKAYVIFLDVYGEQHPDTQAVKRNLEGLKIKNKSQ
jgi:tetratricopeptide (TPR) repeat protein